MSGAWWVTPSRASRSARLDLDVGSGLRLHLDERLSSSAARPRPASVPLTGSELPEGLTEVVVTGQAGPIPVDARFDAAPELSLDLPAPALDEAGGQPAWADLRIGWRYAARRVLPPRTRWWQRHVDLGGWDARAAGLGGFLPDGYLRLSPPTGTIWSAVGTTRSTEPVSAGSPDAPSLPGARAEDLIVTAEHLAHLFDPSGLLRATFDVVRRRQLAAFTHDEQLLTGWVGRTARAGYEVRRDADLVITAPAGQWLRIELDDDERASATVTATAQHGTIEWNAVGLIDAATGPRRQRIELTHDQAGALTSWRHSAGGRIDLHAESGPEGHRSSMITGGGRELSTTVQSLGSGVVTRVSRCCGAAAPTISRVDATTTSVTRPDGSVEFHAVGQDGPDRTVHRVTLTTPARGSTTTVRTTDADGDTFTVTTTRDRRIWVRHFDKRTGTLTTQYPSGRRDVVTVQPDRLTVQRAGLTPTITEYDGGLPVAVRHAGRLDFEHDEHGRLSAVTDGTTRREVHHDAAGRVVAFETGGGWVGVDHDEAGDLVAVTTPAGAVTTFERTADGLVGAIRGAEHGDPGSPIEVRFDYDDDRQLVARSVTGGATVRFERDAAGQVRSIDAGDTRIDVDIDDASAAVRAVRTAAGHATHWVRDGSVIETERSEGVVDGAVQTRYRSDLTPEALVVDDVELPLTHDIDGQPATVGPVTLTRHDEHGLISAVTVGECRTERDYDQFGELAGQRTTHGATVVLDERIERDAHGRVVAVTETDPSGTRVRRYEYGPTGLVGSTVDGRDELVIVRDVNGNPTRIERWGEPTAARFDAADALVELGGRSTPRGPEGELLTDGERTYRFDGLSRLAEVASPEGPVVAHVHDGLNRLIRSSADGSPYLGILWRGGRVAAYDDRIGTRWVCADTGTQLAPDSAMAGDRVVRFVTDHRHSVRAVIDAHSGELLQRIDYDALGRRTHDSAPGLQPFGFAGGLHDPYTGLVHLGARVMDPRIGRFLTRDPLGFEGRQLNVYAYAANDPVNRVDPGGMQSSPSGGVRVCTAPFIWDRPFSVDHVFIETDNWSRGSSYRSGAQDFDKLKVEWVNEKTHEFGSADHAEKECQPVENVDEECLDNFTQPGNAHGVYGVGLRFPTPIAPIPIEPNMCYTEVWDALDACEGPGGWEYSEGAIDRATGDGPGALETAARNARKIGNYTETIWDWVTSYF